MITTFLLAACLVAAQDIVPDRVGFKAATLRALLPPDGKLVEHGTVGKTYVGFALGHRVKAKGKTVYVGDKLGSPGVSFGKGYIELNLGAHVEGEAEGLTGAFDIEAQLVVTVDDAFNVTLRVDHLDIRGDNLGGKIAVAAKKSLIEGKIREEAGKLAGKITDELKRRVASEKKLAGFRVVVTPDGIDLIKGPAAPPPPKLPVAKEAVLHFHTTTDDREGGVVTVCFFANKQLFATVTLPEQKWRERSTHAPRVVLPAGTVVPAGPLYAEISLTEAREKNIGWNFDATLTLNTDGRAIVFEVKKARLDTTGGKYPATRTLNVPNVR